MPYAKLLGILNVWTKAQGRDGKTATIPLSQITGDMIQKRFTELASVDDKFTTAAQKKAAFAKVGITVEQAAQSAKANWDRSTPWKKSADKLPPKVDMPVIEPNELAPVADTLASGEVDVNPPYAKAGAGNAAPGSNAPAARPSAGAAPAARPVQ